MSFEQRREMDHPDEVRRVAIILTELRAGGMEQLVVHLARGLKQRGIATLVFCLESKGHLAPKMESDGVPVISIGCDRSYDVMGVLRLAKQLKDFAPDVINVHDYSSLPYAVVAGLIRFTCPVIFTAHGLLYNGFDGKERRYRFFSRRLRALTAVSREVSQRHRDFLQWQGPIEIVPNGVACEQTSANIGTQVREELDIPDDAFVFLAVGNPRPEKAFEDLIAAAKHLSEYHPHNRFYVLIAGQLIDSEYCRALSRDADTSSVAGLRFLGFCEDVQRLYSAADVLVVSSRSEGLPMVVLEAMTAGLPILSTRVGGIPDAVPSSCGRLVEVANPTDLARGMSEFLHMKPQTRIAMGQTAREHARDRFSVEVMTSRYLDVFANARRKHGVHDEPLGEQPTALRSSVGKD